MSCRRLEQGGVIAVWWHRLWCAECRAARSSEAVITRGIAQLREEPIPPDSLLRTLTVLGMNPAAAGSLLSRQEIRSRLSRVLFLVGLGIFIISLAQPEQIGKSLFEPYLSREGWIGSAAGFWAFTGLFWYLKPIAALLIDHVPLFGSRRRLYLMLSAWMAALLWITTLFAPLTPAMMTAKCIGIGAMLALGSTVLGGFLVEQGQQLGATGRLGALHQFLMHFAALVAAPLGGFLATRVVQITPISGASLLLILGICSFVLMREEAPAPQPRNPAAQAWTQLCAIGRSRTMWSLAAVIVLVFSVSNFTTVLNTQQKRLFIGSEIDLLEFMSHAASLAGILIYLFVCRRFSLRSLLIPGIVGNALGTLLYLGYQPHLTLMGAVLIEVFNGIASALIAVTLFDLAVRAVPVGSACLGYAVLMSVINISSRFSDVLSESLVSHYHLSFAMIVGMSAMSCLLAIVAAPFLPQSLTRRREGEPQIVQVRPRLDSGKTQSSPQGLGA